MSVLVLTLAVSMTLNAQRGMRGMGNDSLMMKRMERMHQNRMNMDRPMMQMPYHRGPVNQMRPDRQGFGPFGPGAMRPGAGFREPGMRMRQDRPMLYNIPGLTDKQKKDIADLRGKQQAEMEKLRIDMQSKMKALREDHRSKVMNLLTPEQKKWLEENTPASEAKK